MDIRPDDVLLTPALVAQRFGLHTGTLNNWRSRGFGPSYVRLGRRVRYPEREVARWLAETAVRQ
jgi:predicted DNA-binding transcriptional regulator AlpA